MKRKLLVVVMTLASVAALTGCGKTENKENGETTTTQAAAQTLSCSALVDGDTTRVTVNYEGDSIKKATMMISEKKASEKEAKAEYEDAKVEQEKLNKYKGLSVNVSYSGTLSTMSMTFTVADMDDDAKAMYEEYFSEIKDKKYDDAKSFLTENKFTCK